MIQDVNGCVRFHRLRQANGPTLSYIDAPLIREDGLAFKDLARAGRLLPYEDWRLPASKRAADLAERLSPEQIAGLMLISGHQFVPPMDGAAGEPWAPTSQQREMIEREHIRGILQAAVDTPEDSVRWHNELQALAEAQPFGIPVSIATDPRHGVGSAHAEFKSAKDGVSKWPEGIGFAAAGGSEIVRRFAGIASREYRALGITVALGPQIDLCTEPRWMRQEDTLGGDTDDVIAMTRAYCDGMQTTPGAENAVDPGWGRDSVVAMVKHWPGGGTGEGGRDAHYAFGAFAVYPGGNFSEHLRPFTEGAFHLDGPTAKAAAVMPYYTVSWGQGEPVGNSYNTHLIRDMLRGEYGYDGVLCTDWGIVDDPEDRLDCFGSRPYGVEKLTVPERMLRIIMNGVDQFGGLLDAQGILAAYRLGCERYGEENMLARFRESAARILANYFRLGLFEDPFLALEESLNEIGRAEYVREGLIAQQKSVVVLKNRGNVLPLKKGVKAYVPGRLLKAHKAFMRGIEPEKAIAPIAAAEAEGYFALVDRPEDADIALVWAESPMSVNKGYDGADLEAGGNGYLPIPLQYRPYTADTAREASIAGGDFREASANRGYRGKTERVYNERDLDDVLEARAAMGDKPVVVLMEMHNPTVLSEMEPSADAIAVHFGVSKRALFSVLFGEAPAQGRLPYHLPASMAAIEAHCEDVFDDYEPYTDGDGHRYARGFGLSIAPREE